MEEEPEPDPDQATPPVTDPPATADPPVTDPPAQADPPVTDPPAQTDPPATDPPAPTPEQQLETAQGRVTELEGQLETTQGTVTTLEARVLELEQQLETAQASLTTTQGAMHRAQLAHLVTRNPDGTEDTSRRDAALQLAAAQGHVGADGTLNVQALLGANPFLRAGLGDPAPSNPGGPGTSADPAAQAQAALLRGDLQTYIALSQQ